MVNIEEKTITLSRQEIKLISDVKLPDMKLPDFEFVRYILAGGDYQELLQEADRLVDAHLADDEYLGNLLSNLQIARMAHEEACYRHHLKDPISYSKEKMKVDIEAANIAFVEFKEDLMQKAL
jgi:elongation factor P--beta-lysine ligase